MSVLYFLFSSLSLSCTEIVHAEKSVAHKGKIDILLLRVVLFGQVQVLGALVLVDTVIMVPIKWVTHAGLTNSSFHVAVAINHHLSPRIENQWKNHFFKMKGRIVELVRVPKGVV